MYLIFDTETTGKPRNWNAPVTETSNWPRMVQIAWLHYDEAGELVSQTEHLVKPEGFTIPERATQLHGISTDDALAKGRPLKDVLMAFADVVNSANILVAHNISFDEKIVGAEFARTKMPNILEKKRRVCTMHGSTNYCKLPGPYGFKWPSLAELHRKLFCKEAAEAHRALADVQTCAACFFELRRRGILT